MKLKIESLKNKCRFVLSWWSVFIFAVAVLWAFYLSKMYRGDDNLAHICVAHIPGNHTSAKILSVACVSPWGTMTEMSPDKDGVWRIPKGEKRTVKELLVNTDSPELRNQSDWRVSLASGASPDWKIPVVTYVDGKGMCLKPQSVNQDFSLFPSRRYVMNWRGDLRFLLLPLIDALYQSLLIVFLCRTIQVSHRKLLNASIQGWNLYRPNAVEVLLYAFILVVFWLLNNRNYDLPTVMYRQFDELMLMEAVDHWIASPIEGMKPLFYGTAFNLFALPFIKIGSWWNGFGGAIVGSRMANSFWMVVCFHLLSRIAVGRWGYVAGILISLFVLSVPFFWIMGTVFHADAMMMAFLIASFVLFSKDKAQLQGHFVLGCALLAGAIAVKAHALMYLPVPFLISLAALPLKPSRYVLSRAFRGLWAALAFYLVMEPRFFLISYPAEYIRGFGFQLWSNQTGFSVESVSKVSLAQKLSTISSLYSSNVVLLGLVGLAIFGLQLPRQTSTRPAARALLFAWLIVVLYYTFYLNKDWAYYYLPLVFVLYLLVIQYPPRMSNMMKQVTALLLLLSQVHGAWNGLYLTTSDYFMPPPQRVDDQRNLNEALLSQSKNLSRAQGVLITFGLSFDYLKAGLVSPRIRYIDMAILNAVADGSFTAEMIHGFPLVALIKDSSWTYHSTLKKLLASLLENGYVTVYENDVAWVLKSPS